MMALWQFNFYMLKKENMKFYDELKPWASDANNESLLLWGKQELNMYSINKISKLLPLEKSWSNTIEQFGNIDSTCLEILYQESDECEISFRLDLRNLSRKILLEILEFIDSHHAGIVYDNKCYQLDESILNHLIENSNAKKFCKNSYEFLQNIKKNQIN